MAKRIKLTPEQSKQHRHFNALLNTARRIKNKELAKDCTAKLKVLINEIRVDNNLKEI